MENILVSFVTLQQLLVCTILLIWNEQQAACILFFVILYAYDGSINVIQIGLFLLEFTILFHNNFLDTIGTIKDDQVVAIEETWVFLRMEFPLFGLIF